MEGIIPPLKRVKFQFQILKISSKGFFFFRISMYHTVKIEGEKCNCTEKKNEVLDEYINTNKQQSWFLDVIVTFYVNSFARSQHINQQRIYSHI
jgi:hypothetical protein